MTIQTVAFALRDNPFTGNSLLIPLKSSAAGLLLSKTTVAPFGRALIFGDAKQSATSTGLLMCPFSKTVELANFSTEAVSFFTSVRVPAGLIAGSSLTACFALVDLAAKYASSKRRSSTLKRVLLSIYHILSLASLLLSLNVILTSTAASTTILLGSQKAIAPSIYDFLQQECAYEFLLTRWSFLASVFCFLPCVAIRAVLEFDLLQKKLTRSALMVFFSIATLFFHLLSLVNEHLFTADSLATMTAQVFQVTFKRNIQMKSFCGMLSIVCFGGSIISAISMLFRAASVCLSFCEDFRSKRSRE